MSENFDIVEILVVGQAVIAKTLLKICVEANIKLPDIYTDALEKMMALPNMMKRNETDKKDFFL